MTKPKPPKKTDDDQGIRCPACHSRFCPVVYTRPTYKGVRRARRCVHCGRQFSTYERTP